ncbi:MAG: SUMF1/EgtB/PvdO family nonheme iron enzyme [Cellvibrio sp.]|nr:SUMF1/EgtB/PvdO family nonheme iron enzyme [Cellvibrio sp.]
MRIKYLPLLASLLACAYTQAAAPVAIEPIMVTIPAGDFMMGDEKSPNAQPVHKVKLESFQLSKYEVTASEFNLFLLATDYKREGMCSLIHPTVKMEFPLRPPEQNDPDNLDTGAAVCITWADANAYISWLNTQTGKHYYLPSEAQ